MTCPSYCTGSYCSKAIWQARDARGVTAGCMKCVRKTAEHACTEYNTNTETTRELNITTSFGQNTEEIGCNIESPVIYYRG
jgi:hypothetical protein